MKKRIIFTTLLLLSCCIHQTAATAECPADAPAYKGKQAYTTRDNIRNTIKSFSEMAIVNLADITGFSRPGKDNCPPTNWNSADPAPRSPHSW